MTKLKDKKLFIFDVDKTICTNIEDMTPYEDALNLANELKKMGKKIAVLTNIGRKSRRYIHRKMQEIGFPVELEAVFTASSVTAAYVKEQKPDAKCFIISESGLIEDASDYGLEMILDGEADYVLVGTDRDMSYEQLNYATQLLLKGAKLVCVSGSALFSGKYLGREQQFLGEMAITKALEFATGVKSVVIGKPYKEMFEQILHELNYKAEETVMIGDNAQTDIAGGNSVGMFTILVKRQGGPSATIYGLNSDAKPDIEVQSLEEVIELLK